MITVKKKISRYAWSVLALGFLLVSGCDYTTPLVETPTLEMDPALAGLWQNQEKGNHEKLLVLPLNKTEYLVVYPAGTNESLFAKASLWQQDQLSLVQLQWLGTGKGALPENERVFQFLAYNLEQNNLSISLLNPDIVSRDLKTPADLTEAILKHKNSAKFFRKALEFKK